MKMIEYTEGCYEVQDAPLGKVYRWCPETVLVECDCGEVMTLTRSETTCAWCGEDYAASIQEALTAWELEDEAVHPWRYVEDREEAGLPC